eukprot:9910784-Heterocapsa_arctica.AAC.1
MEGSRGQGVRVAAGNEAPQRTGPWSKERGPQNGKKRRVRTGSGLHQERAEHWGSWSYGQTPQEG